jgi:hypothetical protein
MGVHWQLSSMWMKAMACFYHSGKMLDELGSSGDSLLHLSKAYDMYTNLRRDAGLPFTGTFDPASYFMKKWKERRQHGDEISVEKSAHVVTPSDNSSQQLSTSMMQGTDNRRLSELTFHDIYKIFQGDSLALETAIVLLTALGQNFLVSVSENMKGSTKPLFYLEALEFIFVMRRSTGTNPLSVCPIQQAFDGDVCAEVVMKAAEPLVLEGSEVVLDDVALLAPSLYALQVDPFIANYEASIGFVCRLPGKFGISTSSFKFPLLAGLVMKFMPPLALSEEAVKRVETVSRLYSTVAQDYGDEVHIMRAYNLEAMLYARKNDVKSALAVQEKVRAIYDSSKHSARMVKVYGGDRALLSISRGAFDYAMVGEFRRSFVLCEEVRKHLINSPGNLHSAGMISLHVALAFSCLGLHKRAHDVMTAYVKLEQRRKVNIFLGGPQLLFYEVLTRRAREENLNPGKQDGSRSRLEAVEDISSAISTTLEFYSSIDEIILSDPSDVVNLSYAGSPSSSLTLPIRMMASFGRSSDSLKAELCLLNARALVRRMNSAPKSPMIEPPTTERSTGRLHGDSERVLNTLKGSAADYCNAGLKHIDASRSYFEKSKRTNYAYAHEEFCFLSLRAQLFALLASLPESEPSSGALTKATNTSTEGEAPGDQPADVNRSSHWIDGKSKDMRDSGQHSPTQQGRSHLKLRGVREADILLGRAADALRDCEALARSMKATTLVLSSALLMIRLGIDEHHGRAVLKEAHEEIQSLDMQALQDKNLHAEGAGIAVQEDSLHYVPIWAESERAFMN